MCICRTCCCGCNLRQGTIGIIIADGIFFGLQLLVSIIIEASLSLLESFGGNVDTVRAIIWILIVPTLLRFVFGIVSVSGGFTAKLRLIHFIGRVTGDVLGLVVAFIFYGVSEFSARIIIDILFLALFIYFNWILWSFYKEDEIIKRELAQNPKQIIVVQQQVPVQGQAVVNQQAYGSVPQQKAGDQVMYGGGGQPGMVGQPMMAEQPMAAHTVVNQDNQT